METYRFDTHVHTSESSFCGKVAGAEVARLYKEAGYQGVVITDHFHSFFFNEFPELSWHDKVSLYLSGYRAALEEGKAIGLCVLLGMEIRFPESINDYLVYGFDESFLFENHNLHKVGLVRFRDITREKGIRIYQAHPFRDDMERVNPQLLDGVEVFNGHRGHNSRNHLAWEYAVEHSLRMIAGSDCHEVRGVGTSGIISPRPIETIQEFVTLLDNHEELRLIVD
jgi:predicted metal-dependent phosphoesterase TrpH